jgi:hypothetical protein
LVEPKKSEQLGDKVSEIEGMIEKLYNEGRIRGLAAGIHFEVRISISLLDWLILIRSILTPFPN